MKVFWDEGVVMKMSSSGWLDWFCLPLKLQLHEQVRSIKLFAVSEFAFGVAYSWDVLFFANRPVE